MTMENLLKTQKHFDSRNSRSSYGRQAMCAHQVQGFHLLPASPTFAMERYVNRTVHQIRCYSLRPHCGNRLSMVACIKPLRRIHCHHIAHMFQIFRAAVKLCGDMSELDRRMGTSAASRIQGHTLLKVTKPESQYLITFDDESVLGEVNASLELALANIAEQEHPLDFDVNKNWLPFYERSASADIKAGIRASPSN